MVDPYDPFREAREQAGAVEVTLDGERLVMLLRYEDVKRATHEWTRYSSDAPFRVPIPEEAGVRTVRQLPIETDPPAHGAYRRVVREPFGRPTAARLRPALRLLVDELLGRALSVEHIEIVRDFALPLQSRALALMLGRPESEAETWIEWGVHVFRDPGGSHAGELDAYLERSLDRAIAAPGDDFFGRLATGSFGDRPLTREEMLGFANLTFAGGRDTMINLVSNAMAHFAAHPEAYAQLRAAPELATTATEEFLRFYAPLTHIGRVATDDHERHGCPVAADERVSLNFASANRDPVVFERADECVLDRSPNRHIAFGHGPHTCLGAPLARATMTVLLERLAARVRTLTVVEREPATLVLDGFERQTGFDRLVMALAGDAGRS